MIDRRDHPIRELATFFDERYQQHMGTRYPFNGGKDAKLLKDLRGIYSDEDIKTFMAAFFEMDDPFIVQSGHSIGVFRGCLPKVIAHVAKRARPVKQMSSAAEMVFRVLHGGKHE